MHGEARGSTSVFNLEPFDGIKCSFPRSGGMEILGWLWQLGAQAPATGTQRPFLACRTQPLAASPAALRPLLQQARVRGYLPAPLPVLGHGGQLGQAGLLGPLAGTALLAGLRSSERVLLLLSFSLCCFSLRPFFFFFPLPSVLLLSFWSVFSFLVLCRAFSSSFTLFFLFLPSLLFTLSLPFLFVTFSSAFLIFTLSLLLLLSSAPGRTPQGCAHPALQLQLRLTRGGGGYGTPPRPLSPSQRALLQPPPTRT